MSSLRNSLHRRSHKERSQLSHRSRLGILEKHKDYVLRARDYHSKQDRINRLREKAATRNKDEFYFSMVREKTQGGVHVKDRGNVVLPVDIVKVLKTQDENYLRTMRVAGMKKIDRLKAQLSQLANLLQSASHDVHDDDELDEQELEVLREAGVLPPASKKARRKSRSSKGKHIIFADNEDEARRIVSAGPAASSSRENVDVDDIQIGGVDMGWKAPEKITRKPRKSNSTADEDAELDSLTFVSAAGATEHRTLLLKELSARLVRDRQLRYAGRELEMQRLLMAKGASRKLSGAEKVNGDENHEDEDRSRPKVDKNWKPRVYRWRVERKR